MTIAARKACDYCRNHFAQNRAGSKFRGESCFAGSDSEEKNEAGIAGIVGRESTPDMASLVVEDCKRLLDRFGDVTLREVALITVKGFTTAEIADTLGCLQRTVQRKLVAIREIWSLEAL